MYSPEIALRATIYGSLFLGLTGWFFLLREDGEKDGSLRANLADMWLYGGLGITLYYLVSTFPMAMLCGAHNLVVRAWRTPGYFVWRWRCRQEEKLADDAVDDDPC